MEFDITRVYTAVNADELKVGSKVICADNLADLKAKVEQGAEPVILQDIEPDDRLYRFLTIYPRKALAYLVEEPMMLKWMDLKIGDVIRSGSLTAMVTSIDSDSAMHIYAGYHWYTNDELREWEKVKQ